jgi:hypothetical protein
LADGADITLSLWDEDDKVELRVSSALTVKVQALVAELKRLVEVSGELEFLLQRADVRSKERCRSVPPTPLDGILSCSIPSLQRWRY